MEDRLVKQIQKEKCILLVFIVQVFNDVMFTPNINKERLKFL